MSPEGLIPGPMPIPPIELGGGTMLLGVPGPPLMLGLPCPILGPLGPMLFGLMPGAGGMPPMACGLMVLGLSSKGLLAYTVSPLPGPAPIMLGGPMSVLGLETGVAVFWLVRRFFLGLPPDWEPLGTLKFCGMVQGYWLRS